MNPPGDCPAGQSEIQFPTSTPFEAGVGVGLYFSLRNSSISSPSSIISSIIFFPSIPSTEHPQNSFTKQYPMIKANNNLTIESIYIYI